MYISVKDLWDAWVKSEVSNIDCLCTIINHNFKNHLVSLTSYDKMKFMNTIINRLYCVLGTQLDCRANL